ncbi:MAG: PTS sugar transporter subunit IIA [Waddliaceae bacterium]|nr:PTS sugar transporter subunit IIA [Waddliaceae bacterium]
MDLKIKDVAELLNVSETTIRRWVVDGKIPAYRLNQQYRFSRIEVENWVMEHRLGNGAQKLPFGNSNKDSENEAEVKAGQQQFSLYRAIHKGNVFLDIPGTSKEEILRRTMLEMAKNLDLDADVLTELLMDREQLMPTALNQGIAVPHTRDFLLNAQFDVITVVFPQKPIPYGALDGEPVHSLFFLFACQDKRHLHLLAKLAHLASNEEARNLLMQRPSKHELLDFIKKWEGSIRSPSLSEV